PRQIFSDFADCTCNPGRDHIACIGIEVRFHEIKRVREDCRRLQEPFDCWFIDHGYPPMGGECAGCRDLMERFRSSEHMSVSPGSPPSVATPELPPRGPEGSILSPERAPEKRPASSGNKMGGAASMPSQY